MKVKTFQDLVVWQKAHAFVLEVYKLTRQFPEEERFGVTTQVRRSSVSICANIVEGYKKSDREFLRFLDISQASLEETKYHLILSKDLGYCLHNTFNELTEICDELGRMINGLMRAIRASKT
ncbi:MAG TPA: four helix bundle protein [Candidatus Omnitrophota bacterium]|nr:four helix bundle protein [Candidatus Omnitrophota bacterium]